MKFILMLPSNIFYIYTFCFHVYSKLMLWYTCSAKMMNVLRIILKNESTERHTVDQIPQKCKETWNLMWFILCSCVCLLKLTLNNSNLRIKCVTESKNVSVLFYRNLKSSFSTWLTHLTLWFLYILGCSGPGCAIAVFYM